MEPPESLAERIDAVLPQTQCGQCGYAGCMPYAHAIAMGAPINQCPPGGTIGVARIAAITGRLEIALNPANGHIEPLQLAFIDEAQCIGCTLCIDACPVDAIAGAPRRMHTVIATHCTGCKLCLPPCPVDCISLRPAAREWTPDDASVARRRYQARARRQAREAEHRPAPVDEAMSPDDSAQQAEQRKQAMLAAALEKARARRRP